MQPRERSISDEQLVVSATALGDHPKRGIGSARRARHLSLAQVTGLGLTYLGDVYCLDILQTPQLCMAA